MSHYIDYSAVTFEICKIHVEYIDFIHGRSTRFMFLRKKEDERFMMHVKIVEGLATQLIINHFAVLIFAVIFATVLSIR